MRKKSDYIKVTNNGRVTYKSRYGLFTLFFYSLFSSFFLGALFIKFMFKDIPLDSESFVFIVIFEIMFWIFLLIGLFAIIKLFGWFLHWIRYFIGYLLLSKPKNTYKYTDIRNDNDKINLGKGDKNDYI